MDKLRTLSILTVLVEKAEREKWYPVKEINEWKTMVEHLIKISEIKKFDD